MPQIYKFTAFCIFILILNQSMAFPEEDEFIEPTTDFSINFINLPQAWQVSKGANVHIGIVYDQSKTSIDWVNKTQRLAPDAKVSRLSKSIFLSSTSEVVHYNIILILEAINAEEYNAVLKAIHTYSDKGTAIILPAYFGPMRKEHDYSPWQKFVRQASDRGAIIVGAHGRNFQIGDLSFWRKVPVDIFALYHFIDSFQYMKFDALIKESLEESAYLVAGVSALLISLNPHMSPIQIKQQLREKGRKIEWVIIEPQKWAYPTWMGWVNDEVEDYIKKLKNPGIFKSSCLDAGMVLGLDALVEGQWCYQVLNVKKAQQLATGKRVTVAILDWLFKEDAPSLKGRIVKPGSVVEEPIFGLQKAGHGTWMANELVKVAPDVKIMPIRFIPSDKTSNYQKNEYPKNFLKGINYAIRNGADIISISFPKLHDDWQEKLDKAIKKASGAGVTIVYIHYYGNRKDIVVSNFIEYTTTKKDHIYVIGTGFLNESSFPLCWGVSQTAPIVAGVIAMMKELKPGLKPIEIREILLQAGRPIEGGYKVLDAFKALQIVKSK